VDAAIDKVFNANGRIDVVVHNAGYMVFGPAAAFTPQQLADLYDINVVSTQRVNRAVLPHMRRQQQGLLVWVSSSSSAGARHLISHDISRPKLRWTRSRWLTLASWSGGASRLPSSFPAHSPAAPITSPGPAHPLTRP
jgi:NAD(P)-dependent dehydrogenase (short-subunit alcohol dehydrogenase family)